jgi:hypothetical protein
MRVKGACHIVYDASFGRALGNVGRVDEHRDRGERRHQAMHQLKAFCDQFNDEGRNAGDIAAGMGEACDEPNVDWVRTDKKTIGIV